MSHIPASKMPHAKPHDEHGEHADAPAAAPAPAPETAPAAASDASPMTSGPEIKPVVKDDKAEPAGNSDAKPSGADAGSSIPFVAIAAIGALAIGGLVAAFALRQPEPAPKKGKGKNKDRSREG